MTYSKYVLQSVTAAFLAVSATTSGAMTPDPETGLIPVRLPTDLCRFENSLPSDLIRQITVRSDFDDLLLHMVENCPTLALDLADFATAAIAPAADDDDDDEEFVRRTGTTTVADTADDNGGDTDGNGGDGGDGGTDGNGGDDGADNGDKNLPGWKIAKKNGLLWKWEKKMARWEQQRAERDAWRAEKKANKYSDDNDKDLPAWKVAKKAAKQNGGDDSSEESNGSANNDMPDWKQAKKQARWEADRIAAEEAHAAKKESKYDPNDGSGGGSVEEEVAEVAEQEEVAQVD